MVFVDGIYLSHKLAGSYCPHQDPCACRRLRDHPRPWQVPTFRIAPQMLSCAMVGKARQRGEDHLAYHPIQRWWFTPIARSSVRPPGHALRQVLISQSCSACSASPLLTRHSGMMSNRHLNTTLQGIPAQRTRLPDGRWVATHARLIQAKNSSTRWSNKARCLPYSIPSS